MCFALAADFPVMWVAMGCAGGLGTMVCPLSSSVLDTGVLAG